MDLLRSQLVLREGNYYAVPRSSMVMITLIWTRAIHWFRKVGEDQKLVKLRARVPSTPRA